MMTLKVSDKGQVTLPARIRRQLGLGASSLVEVDVRGREIVMRPVRTLRELEGALSRYAEGKSADWREARAVAEKAIAEEVMGCGR